MHPDDNPTIWQSFRDAVRGRVLSDVRHGGDLPQPQWSYTVHTGDRCGDCGYLLADGDAIALYWRDGLPIWVHVEC